MNIHISTYDHLVDTILKKKKKKKGPIYFPEYLSR